MGGGLKLLKKRHMIFERSLMLFPTLIGVKQSIPVVMIQPEKDMQTEQLLCWSVDSTDTEHTASGSEEEQAQKTKVNSNKI